MGSSSVTATVRAPPTSPTYATSTARRLATLTGFYRYAAQEGALPHSPVAHIRRPLGGADAWP